MHVPATRSSIFPLELSPVERLGAILVGNALLILSAKIQIPFWPVPMTMQTLVVLLIGGFLGAKAGAATVALYLFEGGLGLPVFAGTPERGIGIAYMYGPTGGYLIGFFVAALVVGGLAERGWTGSIAKSTLLMALGHAIILAIGVAWLARLVGWQTAVSAGLLPFWTATLLKTAMAVAIVEMFRRWRKV